MARRLWFAILGFGALLGCQPSPVAQNQMGKSSGEWVTQAVASTRSSKFSTMLQAAPMEARAGNGPYQADTLKVFQAAQPTSLAADKEAVVVAVGQWRKNKLVIKTIESQVAKDFEGRIQTLHDDAKAKGALVEGASHVLLMGRIQGRPDIMVRMQGHMHFFRIPDQHVLHRSPLVSKASPELSKKEGWQEWTWLLMAVTVRPGSIQNGVPIEFSDGLESTGSLRWSNKKVKVDGVWVEEVVDPIPGDQAPIWRATVRAEPRSGRVILRSKAGRALTGMEAETGSKSLRQSWDLEKPPHEAPDLELFRIVLKQIRLKSALLP